MRINDAVTSDICSTEYSVIKLLYLCVSSIDSHFKANLNDVVLALHMRIAIALRV